ncbi:hypothetical protein LMG28690_00598 [Paraburkholderia caffeinilytica]|nr:hypothetical protein LMG28690_00598 [Paraburkholderia caffeinilytica]
MRLLLSFYTFGKSRGFNREQILKFTNACLAPIAAAAVGTAGGVRPELLVLATGAGSLILSHVNDGGFWLVKEYFGMTVPQTFKTWTVCETIISVTALVLTLGLSTVI